MLKYSIPKNVIKLKKEAKDDLSLLSRESEKRIPLIEKFDFVKDMRVKSFYSVDEYDETCEEHFKIEKIVCLLRDDRKYLLYILLNIFTLGLINLFLNWSPRTTLCLLYQKSSVKHATHMGIYCTDQRLYIVEAFEIDLPKLTGSNITNYCKNNVHSLKTKMFQFKLYKYLYSPIKRNFVCVKFVINSSLDVLSRKFSTGLNEKETEYQKTIYGDCYLEVEIDSIYNLFLEEVRDPFYAFQLLSVIIWIFNDYYKYSLVIILTTIVSLVIAIYELKANLQDIQKMARYNCDVIIHRIQNGEKKAIKCKSSELVPGDLFELPEDDLSLPCDALLISGSVIINESMLTGESIPILKNHIPRITSIFNKKTSTKYILYSGTKIIQKRHPKDSKVMALVIRTGFSTEKGNLIRSVLFPKESNFKFETDSWGYIVFMFFLSLLGIIISIKFMIENDMVWYDILIKGLDLITTTVPPALPAVLGIGISYALSRLKKSGIKCINRQRVTVAGQVNLICFDKTGTLTQDHLQINGYKPINYSKGNFIFEKYRSSCTQLVNESYAFCKQKEVVKEFSNQGNFLGILNPNNEDKIKMLRVLFVECLATCHSITRVNGKLIGDPIDVEMFQSTGWILKENLEDGENYDPLVMTYVRHHLEKDPKELMEELQQRINSSLNSDTILDKEEKMLMSQYEIGIVRRFEFSSILQRMSVIVKNVNEDHFKIFCKGSPEKIRELCREDTIPDNFHSTLANYTSKGYRVLALCCKLIKMDFMQSQKMLRESAENNMIFLGFIIVQNKLKPFTTPSIEILQNAGLKLIMATGDNILTAVSVSRECRLIPPDSDVYQCDITTEGIDNKEYKLNCTLLYQANLEEEEKAEETEPINDNQSDYFQSGLISGRKSYESGGESKSPKSETIRQSRKRINCKIYNKFNNNLNVEVLEDISDDEEEYDLDEYDDDYNNIAKKKADKKKSNYKVENDIDTLRIDLENLNINEHNKDEYVMAVSGNTFEILYKLKNKYLSTNLSQYKAYYDLFRFLLSKAKIYGRMTPDHKTLLIESLKLEKFTVAMCGDGANDIGALRAADVGVSLSVEEASIAAHFTSTVPEITCLIKLLREGKASLITSIQCFKYMMLYSMIQFFSVTFLLIIGTYLSESEFLAVDLFLIFPLAILIARTGAYKELTPHQPTGALISVPIVSSVLLQSFVQLAALWVSYLLLTYQSWYTPYKRRSVIDLDKVEPNYENTTIYLISLMQYLITAVAFSISKPFKKEIHTNHLLCAFLATYIVLTYYLLLVFDPFLYSIFKLSDIHYFSFRIILLIIAVLNFVISVFVEKVVVPKITQTWNEYKQAKLCEEVHQRKRSFDLNELDKIKLNIN